MITEESDVMYLFKDGGEILKVHFLDSYIFMFGEDYQQMFTRGPGKIPPPNLFQAYPTLERVRADAQMYVEGITNKERLLENIDALYTLRKLDKTDVQTLKKFVAQLTPDCSPDSVIKQLILCGYENIAGAMNFKDEHPEFLRSCNTFYKFVCESRQFFENKK